MEETLSTTWKFLPYAEYSPAENMAIDEMLIHSYAADRIPVLRLYGWEPTGISIGYFQDPARFLNLTACASRGIPLVRRLTGGGCIVHGPGITYSMVFSDKDMALPESVKASFQYLCSFIIAFYRGRGLDADYAVNRNTKGPLGEFTDLCWESSQHYDITVGDKKIGGNAQKRSRDIIFQHGFIPTVCDPALHEILREDNPEPVWTLRDLSIEDNVSVLAGQLRDSFAKTFGVQLEPYRFTSEESLFLSLLAGDKYRSPRWNLERSEAYKRTP